MHHWKLKMVWNLKQNNRVIIMNKTILHRLISLSVACICMINIVVFTSGCDNTGDESNTITTVTTVTETAEPTASPEPTKVPVEDQVSEEGKAYFEGLLKEYNNSFIDLVSMLVAPEKARVTWLLTPHYEDFATADYNAVIIPEMSTRKYSDVVSEEEFAELKGDGKTANYWFFVDGAEINALFDQVFEKGRFTIKDLLGSNEDDRITSKGFYMYKDELDYNMYYTYYVNYRYVSHEGNKVILKVNLISAVEISATPGYVGVCEFNTNRNLGRLTLAEGEMPEHYTFDTVKEQLEFNEDSLNEYTFTLIETEGGLRLHSVEI